MTKKCIHCKAEPKPFVQRSFHKFPSDEKKLKQWMTALNLTVKPNVKTKYVCSAHFKRENFFYIDEQRQRRKLRPEAVPVASPCQKNSEVFSPSIDSVSFGGVNKEPIVKIHECFDVKKTTQSSDDEIEILESDVKPIVLTCDDDSEVDSPSVDSVPLSRIINEKASGINKNFDRKKFTENAVIERASSKRKTPFTDTYPNKKVKFGTREYSQVFSRKDFSSEKAWSGFLRCLYFIRRNNAAIRKQISRKIKKLNCLQETVSTLKNQQTLSSA